jgi:hypothetical protein
LGITPTLRKKYLDAGSRVGDQAMAITPEIDYHSSWDPTGDGQAYMREELLKKKSFGNLAGRALPHALFSIVLLTAYEGRAEDIPNDLRGRSIILTWTDHRTVKDTAGEVRKSTILSKVSLYIGKNGTLFDSFERRKVDQTSAIHELKQVTGGKNDLSVDKYKLYWQYSRRQLTANEIFKQGARNIIIDFAKDSAYCTGAIAYGKDPSTSEIEFSDWSDSKDYKLMNISVSNKKCIVLNANIFSGG